ncbi:MAG: histidine kinase, partial [Bacillota bacterium]
MVDFTTGVKKQELKTLDMVVKETTKAIAEGKERIFGIAESARAECLRVQTGIEDLDSRLREAAGETADLEQREQRAREHLGAVSKNFEKHSGEDIKTAFEEVKELQIKLTLLKERRSQLEAQREELIQRVAGLQQTAEQAENLVSQVGLVMD